MDFKLIFLIILVCIVLYLIYDTKRTLEKLSSELPTIEKFTTSIEDTVDKVFTDDIDAIRNLTQITYNILNDNAFNIPANTLYVNNIEIEGSIDTTNNTLLLNLLPKYIVIAWNDDIIPLGWAFCDGNRYSLDEDGNTIEDANGLLTPDLRGRFILGSGVGGLDENYKPLTERILDAKGGTEKHQLIEKEMPAHDHDMLIGAYYNYVSERPRTLLAYPDWNIWNFQYDSNPQTIFFLNSEIEKTSNKPTVRITKSGGKLKNNTGTLSDGANANYNVPAEYEQVPHNNMPPFYTLTYIMKL